MTFNRAWCHPIPVIDHKRWNLEGTGRSRFALRCVILWVSKCTVSALVKQLTKCDWLFTAGASFHYRLSVLAFFYNVSYFEPVLVWGTLLCGVVKIQPRPVARAVNNSKSSLAEEDRRSPLSRDNRTSTQIRVFLLSVWTTNFF